MLDSLSNRQRRRANCPQIGRRLRRPLGFEAMEGRWLLSAMSLEVTSLNLSIAPLTVQVGQFTFAGGQTPQFNTVSEGGFVSLHHLTPGVLSTSDVVVSGTGGSSVTFPITAGINRGNSPGRLVDFNSTGSLDQPAVIVPSDGAILRPDTDQIAGGNSHPGVGRQEGGLIEIKRILEPDQRGDLESGDQARQVAKRVPAESELADHDRHSAGEAPEFKRNSDAEVPWSNTAGSTSLVEVTLDSSSKQRSSDAGRRVISGEWARAVVFEIAGGEPAWTRAPSITIEGKPASAADRTGKPSAAAPLPPGDLGQAVPRTGVRSTISAHEINYTVSARSFSLLAAALPFTAPAAGADETSASPRIGLSAFNVLDAATAEVFAEFGHRERALIRTPTDEDPESITVAATPLLALLVLERVAAHYRSRAEKEVSAVVAGPPRP